MEEQGLASVEANALDGSVPSRPSGGLDMLACPTGPRGCQPVMVNLTFSRPVSLKMRQMLRMKSEPFSRWGTFKLNLTTVVMAMLR